MAGVRLARRPEELAESEGLDPGPELVELMEQLLGEDRPAADLMATVAPAQLPADVVGFAGRAAELAALDRVLAELLRGARPSAVCTLVGPGGIGKTGLALHWGHAAGRHFPDGALYVDLRGTGSGRSLDPDEVLESWLPMLGVPVAEVPIRTAERSAALRTALAGRRLLLVLDNAASTAQVRPLLPGAGRSVALVTSRHRMDPLTVVADAVQVPVGGLPAPTRPR